MTFAKSASVQNRNEWLWFKKYWCNFAIKIELKLFENDSTAKWMKIINDYDKCGDPIIYHDFDNWNGVIWMRVFIVKFDIVTIVNAINPFTCFQWSIW